MATIGVRRSRARLADLGRVDVRMLVGVLLVAVSVVGGLVFWGASRQTVPVLVVSRDLPSGHVLQRDDLTVAQVKLEADQAALAVPADDLDRMVGRTVGGAMYAGELLAAPRLASGPVLKADDAAVTLAVRADSAYPRLRPGDAVAVVATWDKGKPTSQTMTVLPRATVYAVALEPGGSAIGSRAGGEDTPRTIANVTLLVTRTDVERLAHAAVNWDLTLALLPPAANGP